MIPGLFVNHPWLWDVLWQSTACLGAGLVAARLCARRPSLAHAAVTAGLIGAVLAPLLTAFVRASGLGVLAARPAPEVAEAVRFMKVRASEQIGFEVEPAHYAMLLMGVVGVLALAKLCLSAVRGVPGGSEADERTTAGVAAVAASLGLERKIDVRYGGTPAPVVCGWTRPARLVLPTGTEWNGSTRAVVAHELAHLRRRDHMTRLAGELCVVALAWNPLAWLARRAMVDTSELACDAEAVRASIRHGGSAAGYAEALYGLCAQKSGLLSMGATDGRHPVVRRFARILAPGIERDGIRPWQVGVIGAAGIAAVVGAAVAQPAPTRIDFAAMPIEPANAPALREGDHPIAVSELAMDLGVVAPGAYATGWLYLTNLGDEPVRATGMDVDCGCTTVAGFETREIQPGETVPLLVTMQADIGAAQLKTKDVSFGFAGCGKIVVPVSLATE